MSAAVSMHGGWRGLAHRRLRDRLQDRLHRHQLDRRRRRRVQTRGRQRARCLLRPLVLLLAEPPGRLRQRAWAQTVRSATKEVTNTCPLCMHAFSLVSQRLSQDWTGRGGSCVARTDSSACVGPQLRGSRRARGGPLQQIVGAVSAQTIGGVTGRNRRRSQAGVDQGANAIEEAVHPTREAERCDCRRCPPAVGVCKCADTPSPIPIETSTEGRGGVQH